MILAAQILEPVRSSERQGARTQERRHSGEGAAGRVLDHIRQSSFKAWQHDFWGGFHSSGTWGSSYTVWGPFQDSPQEMYKPEA